MTAKRAQTLGSCSSIALLGACGKTLPFPTRISSDTSLGAVSGCPSIHGCPGTLPTLRTPAWLPGQAGQPAWEASLRLGRNSCAALQAPALPPGTSPGPCSPTCARGPPRDTRGAGAARAGAGARGQGAWAAGHGAAGRADKGEPNPQGKAWIRACPRVLSCSHKAP